MAFSIHGLQRFTEQVGFELDIENGLDFDFLLQRFTTTQVFHGHML